MRTFISIKLPTKIIMQISDIQEKLPEFIEKKTELKNMHLTLKFLGEIDSEKAEEIKSRLRNLRFNKFEAEINGIGFFDNPHKGIVWLGITNCDALQKEVDRVLEGLYEKERRFMGHLTIARVKKVQNKRKFIENLKKINVPKMFFIVEDFYLMNSNLEEDGPKYIDLEKYNLS